MDREKKLLDLIMKDPYGLSIVLDKGIEELYNAMEASPKDVDFDYWEREVLRLTTIKNILFELHSEKFYVI